MVSSRSPFIGETGETASQVLDVLTQPDIPELVTGLPAERWGEAVFTVEGQELAIEVSGEKDVIVAVMAGEDAMWKGTLEGFKRLLRSGVAKN